jgi:hypothetical protein
MGDLPVLSQTLQLMFLHHWQDAMKGGCAKRYGDPLAKPTPVRYDQCNLVLMISLDFVQFYLEDGVPMPHVKWHACTGVQM